MPFYQTRRNTLLLVLISGFPRPPDFEFDELTLHSVLTKPVREENLRGMLQIADEQRKSRMVSPTLMGSPENKEPVDHTFT